MLDLRRREPLLPFSTMKPRMPSSVFAQHEHRSAIGAFVIHIFEPLMTQSPPRRFACVFMLAGSEPPCGSVRPKQPISSPLRHARQVLLLLLLAAVGVDRVHAQRLHRDEAAQAGIAALEFLADESVGDGVQAGAAVALERAPSRPSEAISGTSSRGKRCCSKCFWMTGSTFSSTSRATESWTSALLR